MARRPRWARQLLLSILLACACAALDPGRAQPPDPARASAQPSDAASTAPVHPTAAPGARTDDSLAWAASLAHNGASQPEARISPTMAWVARTSLGRTTAGRWFIRGGALMWLLLVFALATAAVIVERAWTLARARTDTRRLIGGIITSLRNDGVTAATQVCERTRGPVAAILHSGLLRADRGPEAVEKAIETAGTIEMSFLERGLSALSASASIAPLIGFLGTVTGLMHAFDALSGAGRLDARAALGGVSEALITTLTGLAIAVPASIAHSFFLSVIDRFIIEMEQSAAELVEELSQVSG